MALHEQCVGATDEWYTPQHVFDALGCEFDMDVSAPEDRRYVCTPAKRWLWSDSLSQTWYGFVWMNPPFGGRNGLIPWLDRFFLHNSGIALVPDRTSAPWWQIYAPKADAILFVSPKLKFIGPDGKPGNSPAQGTCLLAAGEIAESALRRAERNGLGVLMTPSSNQLRVCDDCHGAGVNNYHQLWPGKSPCRQCNGTGLKARHAQTSVVSNQDSQSGGER